MFLMMSMAAMVALSACEKKEPVNPDENGGDGKVEMVRYTDILTWDMFTEFEERESLYFDFADFAAPVSDAVYAGNITTYKKTSIQMRSKSSDSGIVTTISGGKRVVKVAFVWNPDTEAGGRERKVELWGKDEAYDSAADLYEDAAKGELLGSNIFDTDNLQSEITVEGDYPFIGIRSADGAVYFDRIEITWEAVKKY